MLNKIEFNSWLRRAKGVLVQSTIPCWYPREYTLKTKKGIRVYRTIIASLFQMRR
jgi:hypothetical protein